jgi:hypothetical protein
MFSNISEFSTDSTFSIFHRIRFTLQRHIGEDDWSHLIHRERINRHNNDSQEKNRLRASKGNGEGDAHGPAPTTPRPASSARCSCGCCGPAGPPAAKSSAPRAPARKHPRPRRRRCTGGRRPASPRESPNRRAGPAARARAGPGRKRPPRLRAARPMILRGRPPVSQRTTAT